MKALTNVDVMVIKLIAEGKTTKEIATETEYSDNHIEWCRIRIMRKMRVINTAQMISQAYKQKILEV